MGAGNPWRLDRHPWRWTLGIAGGLTGLVIVAAILVWTLVVEPAMPYSQQQMDHALAVIGAPPGFSAGQFFYQGGGLGEPAASLRDYDGSGSVSQSSVYNWYVSRLTSLGFKDVAPDGTASCRKFGMNVAVESDDLIVGANVTRVEVSAGSQGINDAGPACPRGLFG